MKVTKYPQSCLLIEKDGRRIVIDPGKYFGAKYDRSELGEVEAVLYTHNHRDHFDANLAEIFRSEGVPMYGNESVCELLESGYKVVVNKASFNVGGFEVVPYDLPHCVMPDGSAGPPNTGYMIDGHFFDPGDGVDIDGLKPTEMAVAIAGPSISLREAVKFVTKLEAKKVIPVHCDNIELFPGNPNGLKAVYSGAEVIVLQDGESVEL